MTPPEDPYAFARDAARRRVREEFPPSFHGGELDLQARLFAGDFGVSWTGEDGEKIEVLHFGSWNREAGPDFCGVKIKVNGKVLTGDLELDMNAADWEVHGHGRNRAYSGVLVHAFLRRSPARRFYTRTADHRSVIQVCLGHPDEPGKAPRTLALSGDDAALDPEQIRTLVEAAARFRLAKKQEAFQRAVFLHGRGEALFQALAAGLGYKHNKIPFLLVAQRAGLPRARREEGEALLFGLAGFLKAREFDSGHADARRYLGGLWKVWWLMRSRESRVMLPPEVWRFSGLRPANHPHRRMGALAALARAVPELEHRLDARDAAGFQDILAGLDHPFWRSHATLSRQRLSRETALIGADRARDLLINAFLPALPAEAAWRELARLRGPAPSGKVRKSAEWLGLPPGENLSAAALQQGLLQVHDDFYPEAPRQVWTTLRDHGWTKGGGRSR